MPRKAKAKNPYSAPSFRRVDAQTAKAVLETRAVSRDAGAEAMMELICKTKRRSNHAESTLQLVEKLPREKGVEPSSEAAPHRVADFSKTRCE